MHNIFQNVLMFFKEGGRLKIKKVGKSFKMFTFSILEIEHYTIYKDRIRLLTPQIALVLSLYVDEAI